MLAVSPPRDAIKDENEGAREAESLEFPDFGDSNLLDSIDFDDLFLGISDGDVLPDLEMDPDILADFSSSTTTTATNTVTANASAASAEAAEKKSVDDVDCREEEAVSSRKRSPSGGGRAKSSASQSQPKRKVKVDWTAELHRRFVQAVEQLGVDKAVPSRILEIMGIDCLTRHNIASHLQKYRSHRKHLLAREAEAASWSQRRQMYGTGKREASTPWAVAGPTMGFPPPTPPPPPPPMMMHGHFRPLHVWGHPSADQSLLHVWPPKQGPSWLPDHPPSSYNHWHHHHRAVTPGTPCFPHPQPPPPRLALVPATVAPLPPPPPGAVVTAALDILPSKESIDAAIGDVLAKPWLPLPLGLKPPAIDSVMGELQRQGVPDVPPSCA